MGTANGVATSVQMFGIGCCNIIVGALKDNYGWTTVLYFFTGMGTTSFLLTVAAPPRVEGPVERAGRRPFQCRLPPRILGASSGRKNGLAVCCRLFVRPRGSSRSFSPRRRDCAPLLLTGDCSAPVRAGAHALLRRRAPLGGATGQGPHGQGQAPSNGGGEPPHQEPPR